MSVSPLIARALEVAEKHLGIEELCRRLVVPEELLRAWKRGHTTMPQYKFLRLVDILTELDPDWKAWDEANSRE